MSATIKICGLKDYDAIQAAVDTGAKYLGFVCNYPKSPRSLSPYKLAEITKNISNLDAYKVAVVVDPDDTLIHIIKDSVDFLQLHGSETNERVLDIKKKFNLNVIKAIKVKTEDDLKQIDTYNIGVMVSHIPGVVNASVSNGPLHYFVHMLLVMTSILMWLPVIGPFKEFQMKPMGKMIYLFLNSVVATIPAGWLTFAEGVVYKSYNIPERVWGMSVSNDQQIAGAMMKLGGSIFLWTIIVAMFFRHFVKTFRDENKDGYVRKESVLTTADVERAFEATPPVEEPRTHK